MNSKRELQLLRLFHQVFNKTPHQYLIERRIEKAKELLGTDELRVTDVCFEVGFQSSGSFSSLFHKYVGHAPITYREKVRQRANGRMALKRCSKIIPATGSASPSHANIAALCA